MAMSHYEERLEQDLVRIRSSIRKLAEQVEAALQSATEAMLTGDREKAYATVLGDHPINRNSRELDRLCHAFIARHLPSAGHLRLMSSIIRVNIALERVGDYAVTICREALQMNKVPKGSIANQLKMLADEALGLLTQSVDAFLDENAEQARTLMPAAARVENNMDGIYDKLIEHKMQKRPRESVADFVVFGLLKRICDQAKNICDQTVFAVEGEIKRTKFFEILFIDEDNSRYSKMAEALASKRFPTAAQFTSAGRAPAARIDAELLDFLDDRGVSIAEQTTQSIDSLRVRMPTFNIIIALQGKVHDYIEHLPFHAVGLNWAVAGEEQDPDLDHVYRDLVGRIDGLMQILVGPGNR
jgi:phosphate transport system protein